MQWSQVLKKQTLSMAFKVKATGCQPVWLCAGHHRGVNMCVNAYVYYKFPPLPPVV